jgi:hypothetical protein
MSIAIRSAKLVDNPRKCSLYHMYCQVMHIKTLIASIDFLFIM